VRLPDLVVYLRAHLDTLMARIAMRDRTFERKMDRDYIAALRHEYERLFADYSATSLLVIETDMLDFVRNPDDLDAIEQRIHAALAGVRQPTLPRIAAWDKRLGSRAPKPSPAQEWRTKVQEDTEFQALGDFLALAEAVGRVGGALGQGAAAARAAASSEAASEAFREALVDATRALSALAQSSGIGLSPDHD
jgi:hypothetical protein